MRFQMAQKVLRSQCFYSGLCSLKKEVGVSAPTPTDPSSGRELLEGLIEFQIEGGLGFGYESLDMLLHFLFLLPIVLVVVDDDRLVAGG